jgi:hypothetical protein
MAVTDYDFLLTRNEIIALAYGKCGLRGEGQQLNPAQLDEGRLALNEIVKFLQTRHLFLYSLSEQTIPMVIGTATYSLGTDPAVIAVDRAFYRDGSNDIKVDVISRRDYFDLTDKASTGDPVLVTIDYPAGGDVPDLLVYPIPNRVVNLHVLTIRRLEDWDSASGSADFPVRWQLPLIYELAAYLAEDYKLPGSEQDRLRLMADRTFMEAKRSDRDRSDYETVDGAY